MSDKLELGATAYNVRIKILERAEHIAQCQGTSFRNPDYVEKVKTIYEQIANFV